MRIKPQYLRSMLEVSKIGNTGGWVRTVATRHPFVSGNYDSVSRFQFSGNRLFWNKAGEEVINFTGENVKKGFSAVAAATMVGATTLALGWALHESGLIPEELEEYIERKIEFKRPKIMIEPELFDPNQYIARNGTKELEQDFETKRSAGSPTMLSLIGPSGSGKTEMAAECAYKYCQKLAEKYPSFDRIVYVLHAENTDVLEAEYRRLATRMEVFSDKQTLAEQMEELRDGVNDILHNHSKWMLVFDNVTDYDVIKGYLPPKGRGRVLVTSQHRLPGFAEDKTIDILSSRYSFTEEEAIALFKKRNLGINNTDKIKRLAMDLMYLPLAINRATILCSAESELDLLIQELSAQFPSNERNVEKINLFINKKIINKLSVNARAMLAVMVYSNPDYTDTIARMSFDIKALANHLFGSAISEDRDGIMLELKSFGLLTGAKGYKNHRAMKRALIEWIKEDKKKPEAEIELNLLTKIAQSIYSKLSMSNYYATDVTSNNPFLPHVLSFFTHIEEFYNKYPDQKSLELYLKGISYLSKMATNMISYNPEYARKYLNMARIRCERLCDETIRAQIRMLSNADYLMTLDLLKQTIPSLEHTIQYGHYNNHPFLTPLLDIFRKLSSVHRHLPDLYASTLYQLGRTYFHTQKPNEFVASVTCLTSASILSKLSEQKTLGSNPRNYKEIIDPNNPYDENRYGIVFRDNALYFLYLDKFEGQEVSTKNINRQIGDLETVKELYQDSINEELNQNRPYNPGTLQISSNRIKLRNNRTIVTCFAQQLRAYQELCLVNETNKQEYLARIDELFNKIEMVVGSTLLDVQSTKPNLDDLKRLLSNEHLQESDIEIVQKSFKKSDFYLARGQYFIIKEDYKEAKRYYLTVIKAGSDVTRRIDAYKGLLASIFQVPTLGINSINACCDHEALIEAETIMDEFSREGLLSHPRSEEMKVIKVKLKNEIYQREVANGLER